MAVSERIRRSAVALLAQWADRPVRWPCRKRFLSGDAPGTIGTCGAEASADDGGWHALGIDTDVTPSTAGGPEPRADRARLDRPRPDAVDTTRRRGRMTPAKHATIARLAPTLGLDADDGGPWRDRLVAAFGRDAPRLLDVGVGAADATIAWALAHPDQDVVAVEVHRPSLAAAFAAVEAAGVDNLRIVEADVRRVLADLEPGDVTAVRVLFPDPWPKARHHKRRLVGAEFVARVADVVPPGGWLHVATDWPDYAGAVRAAIAAEPRLEVVADPGPLVERPVTVYERRGLDAGRPPVDVVARRRA